MLDQDELAVHADLWSSMLRCLPAESGPLSPEIQNTVVTVLEILKHVCRQNGILLPDPLSGFHGLPPDALNNGAQLLFHLTDSLNIAVLLSACAFNLQRLLDHPEGIPGFRPRSWFTALLNQFQYPEDRYHCGIPLYGKLAGLRLRTDSVGHGPQPPLGMELRQELKLLRTGEVHFSGFAMTETYKWDRITREQIFSLPAAWMNLLFSFIEARFTRFDLPTSGMDAGGIWSLLLTNTDGESYILAGYETSRIEQDGINLSEMLQNLLGIEGLMGFAANDNTDSVRHLEITLDREANQDAGAQHERLLLDADTGTLELEQTGPGDREIYHRYRIRNEVDQILGSTSFPNGLAPAREPEDLLTPDAPHPTYQIQTDYRYGGRASYQGYADRYGLPQNYRFLAQNISNCLKYLNGPALLDSAFYLGGRRRKGDLIYLGVSLGGNIYHYLSDSDEIQIGDAVLVPVGPENRPTVAWVQEKQYCTKKDAPYPVHRTKHILGPAPDPGPGPDPFSDPY